MKLRQNIKIIINGKESEAIPFKDFNHAKRWTKEEQEREDKNLVVKWYGRYSWDIEYLDTKNILKIRFY